MISGKNKYTCVDLHEVAAAGMVRSYSLATGKARHAVEIVRRRGKGGGKGKEETNTYGAKKISLAARKKDMFPRFAGGANAW